MISLRQNEADILQKLSYPSFSKFIDTVSSDSMLCVIREYVEGITLDIHRDLKPQNIILREDGSVALIDFGISRIYHSGYDADTVIVGTKHFAAPEQYGFSQTDCRSDLFSLGVVLNYLLTGSAKVDASCLPVGSLKKVVLGCTEFSPNDRFANASVVKLILSNFLSKKRSTIKKRPLATVLICLVLLISAEIFVLQQQNRFTEPLIKQAALTSLGKSSNATLTEEDYLDVETLWIVGDKCYKDGTVFYEKMSQWYENGSITQ